MFARLKRGALALIFGRFEVPTAFILASSGYNCCFRAVLGMIPPVKLICHRALAGLNGAVGRLRTDDWPCVEARTGAAAPGSVL